jgi:YYY domain-containing protein
MKSLAVRRYVDITVWLIPALAALLAWQLMGGAALRVAGLEGDDALAGFYPPEQGDLGAFRWAGGAARVTLPGGGLPGVIELRGALAPAARATVELGGGPPVALTPGETAQIRRFRLLTPAVADQLGRVELRLRAERPALADGRELSVALAELRVMPVRGGLRPPPPGAWLALAGLPMLLGAWLWLGGAPVRVAGLVSAGLGLLLAAGWRARPAALDGPLLDLAAFVSARPLWLWWLLAHLAGFALWPATATLLRGLPLRGYPLAIPAGLLAVAWPAWALAVAGLAPFGAATLAGSWLALGLACWGLWWRRRRAGSAAPLMPPWRAALAWELLLLAGLLAGCWLRWHGAVGPALTGTEKPMEIAMLGAVMRSERFPPADPWLAGYGLNYYYLGYVIVGALAELGGTPPAVAFNLGFALVVALSVVGAAYAGYSLIALTPGLARRAPLAAALAVLLALVVGSQASALQLIVGSPLWRALDGGQLIEALGQRLAGAEPIRLSRPTPPSWDGPPFDTIDPAPRSFDWFAPSRAIYDDVILAGGGVERRYAITEFPAFSLYLGDLHPHILAVPFNLLALALAAQLASGGGRAILWPATAGFLVGCLYCLNAWDAPTYGLLLAGALALGRRGEGGSLDLRAWLLDMAVLAAAALLAALPFLLTFTPPAGPAREGALDGLPLLGRLAATFGLAASRTQLHSFLALFGLFLLPLLALALARGSQQSPLRRAAWLWPALLVGALIVGPLAGFPLLFLLPLALLLASGAWRSVQPGPALLRWAAALGALALLAPELVYIRDQLEGEMSRMITIFKFVFQAWLLWAVAASAAAAALFRPRAAPLATAAWAAPAALLLAGALVYPAGLLAWAEPWRPGERGLDGLAFMAREAPDELAAAEWLAARVSDDSVVLAGFCNCDYERVSRLGAVSAAPTLLGWMDGHERVWRSGAAGQLAEIARREADIPRMFGGGPQGLALLRRYGVDYVYIGPVERRLYPSDGLAALAGELEPVFAQGAATIYRVPAGDE